MGLVCVMLAGAATCGVPLADDRLAAQRGGFSLPSGIDVAISIDTQTAVNGAIVLRSIFHVDQGPARTAVFVPRTGQVVPAGPTASGGGVAVRVDRGAAAVQPGLVRAGAGTVTDHGVVVIDRGGTSRSAGLRDVGLDITHLAGSAIGSAVVNTDSARAIETRTTVSIDLHNAGPDVLGSAMLQAMSLASDAVAGRVR